MIYDIVTRNCYRLTTFALIVIVLIQHLIQVKPEGIPGIWMRGSSNSFVFTSAVLEDWAKLDVGVMTSRKGDRDYTKSI